MSVLLAMRFGGTPWQWRECAEDEDWGTALKILAEQARQIEDMRRR